MKKLLITLEYPPMIGGVANYLSGVCANLKDVIVLKPKFFRFFWPKWPRSFFEIIKIIKKEDIKLIMISHILPVGYISFLIKKIYKIDYIIFVHGMDILLPQKNKWKKFWLKKILKNACGIVANSEFSRNAVLKLGIKKEKTEVVYPCPNKDIKTLQFKNNPSKKVILTVGRLIERKGIDKVIEAMPKILKEIPNTSYIIVGDGEYKNELEKMVKEKNLKSSVSFCGKVQDSDMRIYYGMSDIFIMPSRAIDGDVEGFGIVYLEAALFGKPSIAGCDGGSSEAVLDNKTGFIVNGKDVDEIANKVIELLKNDDLRKKMGENAKQRVSNEFIWEKQVEKIKFLI